MERDFQFVLSPSMYSWRACRSIESELFCSLLRSGETEGVFLLNLNFNLGLLHKGER